MEQGYDLMLCRPYGQFNMPAVYFGEQSLKKLKCRMYSHVFQAGARMEFDCLACPACSTNCELNGFYKCERCKF